MMMGIACSPGRAIRDFYKFNFLRKVQATNQQGRQLHRLVNMDIHIQTLQCNELTLSWTCGYLDTSQVNTLIFELP